MREPNQSDDAEPPGAATMREEIDELIAGLDRAARRISSRLEALRHAPDRTGPEAGIEPAPAADEPLSVTRVEGARSDPEGPGPDDRRRLAAEQEARSYLEQAKRRAERLLESMIGAAEQEAAGIRDQAERETERYAESARRVADDIVVARQHQLSVLSDGIVERAQALTAGLEDALRVRRQFEDFVRGLSQTAERIADSQQPAAEAAPTGTPRARPAPEENVAA